MKKRYGKMAQLLVVLTVLGAVAVLYHSASARLKKHEYHSQKNRRISEMLVLARVEIPQYLADNPDISQKEFAEYAGKIRKERNFFVNSDLEQWKKSAWGSDAAAVQDLSPLNVGYCTFDGSKKDNGWKK